MFLEYVFWSPYIYIYEIWNMAHSLQSTHIIFTLINEEVSKRLGCFKWIKLNLILSLQCPSNHENYKDLTNLCTVNFKNPFFSVEQKWMR